MAIFAETSNLPVVIGAILALLSIWYVGKTSYSPIARVPGPWYSLWTSWVLDYHTLNASRVYYVHALHEKYGPIVRIGPSEVEITDLDAIALIYDMNETFPRGLYYRNVVQPGSESLFSTLDVKFHRHHRKLLGGPMSETSLKPVLPDVQAMVKLAVQRMAEDMATKGHTDILKWWFGMALDAITHLTFGESFQLLDLTPRYDYHRVMAQLGRVGGLRVVFPTTTRLASSLPFKIPLFGEAKEAADEMTRYSIEALQCYQRILDDDPAHAPPSLFAKLFRADKSEAVPFKEMQDDAESYIMGGSDAPAQALTMAIWELCRHPEVKDELLQELQTLPHDYTDENLRELPILSNIINEALRMYPVAAAVLPRRVPAGGRELVGYWLDEGTTIGASAYTMHRLPDVFPQAEEFIPSRWANTTQAMRDSQFSWGKGSRQCIGKFLALSEMRLAIAHFFLMYPNSKVSSAEGMSDKDLEQVIYFEAQPAGGRCLMELA